MRTRTWPGRIALPQVGREVWLLCIPTGLINAGYLSMMGLLKTIFVLRLGYEADFVATIMAVGSLSFALSSLHMDDWMWLVDDRTLINRTTFSKFGIAFGEVTIFFRKR